MPKYLLTLTVNVAKDNTEDAKEAIEMQLNASWLITEIDIIEIQKTAMQPSLRVSKMFFSEVFSDKELLDAGFTQVNIDLVRKLSKVKKH